MTWSNVGLGNYSKAELGLYLARGGRGGRVRHCRLECPDNRITQDVGEIVNSLDVFVPRRLSWLWHDS